MNDRTIAQWLVRNERYQTPESKRTPIPETDEAWEPYDSMANIYIKKIKEIPTARIGLGNSEKKFTTWFQSSLKACI